MRSFGDRFADSIAYDLSTEWLHWLHAAMPKLVKNLLACEDDEAKQATECLVLLGAAFPDDAIYSRKLVEAVWADPEAAERAKARLAAQAPTTDDRAAAKVDFFMQMAREAMEVLCEDEEEKAFMAAVGAYGRDMGDCVWNRHDRVDHCYDAPSEASVSVFRADAAGGVRWFVVETYSRWGGGHDIHNKNVTEAESEEAAVRLAEESFACLVERIGRDCAETDARLQYWEDQQIAEFKRRAAAV